MNTPKIIGLSVAAFAALILMMAVGYNNTAANYEASIIAADTDSQNVLGQYAPKLQEAIGVSKLQVNAVKDVISGANASRYGADGSKADVQWIQEQNPQLNQQSYQTILDIIQAGRDTFQLTQRRKIDEIRSYRSSTQQIPGKWFYSMMGYPTPGFFDKYDHIVVSSHAQKAFQTGIDDGVKF